MTPEEEQAVYYTRHKSGILVRESVGVIEPYSARPDHVRVTLRPYGWLRGMLLVLDAPLPNMDASRPYALTAALHDFDGRPVARAFRVQQIAEAIDGLDPFDAYPGETPRL